MRALTLLFGAAVVFAQSPQSRFQEAQHALSEGRAADAIAILTELAASDPAAAVLWVNLGLAHYQKGDYLGAQAPLEKALALDDRLRPALALLGLSKAA